MLNLNPTSPFSGKAMSDCDEREKDAWCAKLCGHGEAQWSESMQDWVYEAHGHMLTIPANYGTSWAAAGPLMEREEWPSYWILSKDSLANKQGYSVLDMIDDSWDLITFQESPTAAIRNAFIIAASHAAQREGGVS